MSIFDIFGRLSRTNQKIVLSQAAFSACALIALAMVCVARVDTASMLGVVYGACLLACSVCSYLYTIRVSGLSAALLKRMDHAAIFLLIAGTYTPFAAVETSDLWGVPLIGWVWGFAAAGMALRLAIIKDYNKIFVGLYVVLGWLFIMAIADSASRIPGLSLVLMGLGAAAYSVGAAVFARDIGRWTDAVWHASVFAAAVFHFMAILNFVLETAG